MSHDCSSPTAADAAVAETDVAAAAEMDLRSAQHHFDAAEIRLTLFDLTAVVAFVVAAAAVVVVAAVMFAVVAAEPAPHSLLSQCS